MTIYRKDPNALEATVGTSLVILNTELLTYFELTEVAGRIWELLEEGIKSIDDLVAVLLAEYDVEESACRGGVESFMQSALAKGLVIAE